MERVSVIRGRSPFLVVAPHGYERDDQNTAFIAERIAAELDCFAVINRGWERSTECDALSDKADCNNVFHCKEDVVREEFLDPIVRFKNRILRYNHDCFIIHVHGMSNKHRQISKEPNLGVVVGYGDGTPSRFTCELWHKNLLLRQLNDGGLVSLQGGRGGPMSGWSISNMNQYFRHWERDDDVQSMQMEIVYDLRRDRAIAEITAHYISMALKSLERASGYNGRDNFGSY